MARLVVDPVTRVGGHLRIEADVAAGQVTDAWSSGTMFRGIESLIVGRDPRDAWMFAERICGTCTGVHALASVRAVERAFGVTVPKNARLIRNLLAATLAIRDHALGFYLSQAPDWVDVKAASTADPAAASLLARARSEWKQSSAEYFTGVRDRLAAVIGSNQPGPYGNGYWGHPAYRLSPAESLVVCAHGLEALDWQRRLMRIHTLLGGRDPHPQTYIVGGMALTPPWGGPPARLAHEHPQVPQRNAPDPLGAAGLTVVLDLIADAQTFVNQVLVPDVLGIAAAYPEWARIGAGPGGLLSYGEYPEDDGPTPGLFLPRGRILGRDLSKTGTVEQEHVAEAVAHAWYADSGEPGYRLASAGVTSPAPPAIPFTGLDGAGRYSWMKAPRYDDTPLETGPLARLLVAYVNGQPDVKAAIEPATTALGGGPDALFGTLGRLVASAVEAKVLADHAFAWFGMLEANLATGDLAVVDASSWDPRSWPDRAEGWSLGEGPRGAVGHWVSIRDQVVERYQVVDATTWNASPRDAAGTRGPLETALVGTRVADPAQPLELLRVVHSFSPCAACAVHAFDPHHMGPVAIHVRNQGSGR
jgi:Ni,Fe-hydrogenase I large subunit